MPARLFAVPHVCGKGTPSLTVKILPSFHPLVGHFAGPLQDLAEGISQVPFPTRVRLTSKAERPRVSFISNQFKLEIEFPNASPASVAELVSMLLPQV